jgi:hypothetical protein
MAGSEEIVTINPDVIREWVQERGGEPMKVRGTGSSGMDPAVLVVVFPGAQPNLSLEPLGWDDWLVELDEQQLAAVMRDAGTEHTFKVMRKDRVVMTGLRD